MVPVIDQNNNPLFPCKERRARALLSRKEAVVFWQKGLFCIKLIRKETEKREEYPELVVGVDTGSSREGYTVASAKGVVLSITTNTPSWVKDNVEARRNLRRTRRQRKTPYRACRPNRSCQKQDRIPPSTKARWSAKLRVIKFLQTILPITTACVEDIKVEAKEGSKKKWNKIFSPLEVGKNWFYTQLKQLGLKVVLVDCLETAKRRELRGFEKSSKKDKMKYIWESHNVDSHSLCEIALDTELNPFRGIWKLEFLKFHRRQLHVQNPKKNNFRKEYGKTVSMGMSRGSVLRYKKDNKLYYLGGTSKGTVAIHSIATGKRSNRYTKVTDIKNKYTNSWRLQFLPVINDWVSLQKLG